LRKGLSNNVIQYKDAETGNIITTTSTATRKSLEKQLDRSLERQDLINIKIDSLNSKIFDLNSKISEVKISNEVAAELGPLKYISKLTGWEMDKVVNIFLLVLVFVFDPLAISLVVAANFGFEQIRKKKYYNIYQENPIKKKPKNETIMSKKEKATTDLEQEQEVLDKVQEQEESPKKEEKLDAEKAKQNILNTSGLSSFRKNKLIKQIDDGDNDLVITYS